MTLVEKLVEHTHTCSICKEKNPSGTKFDSLVLCIEGAKIRQATVDENFWRIVRQLLWVAALMIIGSVLVGHKLGAEAGIGAFLLAWSVRFEIG